MKIFSPASVGLFFVINWVFNEIVYASINNPEKNLKIIKPLVYSL